MTTKSEEKEIEVMSVNNDLDGKVDLSKLQELRAKKTAKEQENMPPRIVEKKKRSIKLGICGTGHAGSNIASCMYDLGYPAIVFNTASQDLESINIPNDCKMLLEFGLGGAAKEKALGQAASEAHREAIGQLAQEKLGDEQVLVLCTSLAGGSGAGSVLTMIDILLKLEKPIIVISVLPLASEDAASKRNALETLSDLTKELQNKRICNLIVVDNAKIEAIYSNVNQFDFYRISNEAIVKTLDIFNTYSSMSSAVKALDSAEFARILIDGSGLTIFGEITVTNFEDETSVASAVIDNLSAGLLAEGFDLKQTKYVGFMLIANKNVWNKISSAAINYAGAMIQETAGVPNGVFKGIYSSEEIKEDVLKIYSIFSGLGLPSNRIETLQKETVELINKTKTKDENRNLNLKVNAEKNEVISSVDKIKEKIAMKKSAFGGLMNGAVQDRRKK